MFPFVEGLGKFFKSTFKFKYMIYLQYYSSLEGVYKTIHVYL